MDKSMTPAQRNDILSKIKEGMEVIDVDGDKVGTVEFVRMAREGVPLEDRKAQPGEGGPLLDFAQALTGAEGEVTDAMLQFGFVRVDAAGWFTGRRYIPPEQIDLVDAKTVRLKVDKDSTYKP
jgi:hypothetical protein